MKYRVFVAYKGGERTFVITLNNVEAVMPEHYLKIYAQKFINGEEITEFEYISLDSK